MASTRQSQQTTEGRPSRNSWNDEVRLEVQSGPASSNGVQKRSTGHQVRKSSEASASFKQRASFDVVEIERKLNKKRANLRRFATSLLLVMVLLKGAFWLIDLGTGYAFEQVGAAVDGYLLLLMWASTLPLHSRCPGQCPKWCPTWQLNIAFLLPLTVAVYIVQIVTRLGDSINEKDGDVLFLAKSFLSPVFMIFLYWVLVKMKQALRMIYGDGIFDLSARLTGRLIAGLPLVGFLSLSMISAIIAEKQSFDTMCTHILGAKPEATAGVRNSIQKKLSENCTNNELYKRFEHKSIEPTTIKEVLISQEMDKVAENHVHATVAFFHLVEFTVTLLTLQVLLRLRRFTIKDVLYWRVTGKEFALSLVTVLRIGVTVSMGAIKMDLEWIYVDDGESKPKKSRNPNLVEDVFVITILVLYILAFFLMCLLVRDVTKEQDKAELLRKDSASLRTLAQRSRRQSSQNQRPSDHDKLDHLHPEYFE